MSKYLKKFETQAAYEAAQSGLILPNVSLTVDNNTVHYNPSSPTPIETRLVCKYNVTNTTNPIALRTNYEQNIFKSMEIDGVMLDELVTEYTFDTTGVHTVKYELYDETKLGNSAPIFYNSNLTECIIPDSVTSIGNNAFNACTSLTSINIPSGVTSIGSSAFFGCSGLISAIIPDSVTSIDSFVFSNCRSLTSIDIPSGVTSIGQQAFAFCSSFTSVTIPDSVTTIGDHAFNGCSGLTSMTVDNNNTVYDSRNNCNAIIITSTNTLIAGCKNTVIPNSVTSIGSNAFADCTSLTNIDIPNSVTSIDTQAFYQCSGLTSCTIGSDVTSIGQQAFYYCTSLTSIVCNATTAPTITNTTFQYIKASGALTVPSGSSGYDTWMQNSNYYLGLYNWTKVEQ